jgi:Zn-dependent peptidase ImmA (M78 family)
MRSSKLRTSALRRPDDVALRRGFKTEANDIASEVRSELQLSPTAPFDPRALATHLEIPIVPLSDFSQQIPDAVRYFRRGHAGEFSAVTVFADTARLIVYNDAHAAVRQASDLSHELSHALLFHEPKPALNALGCRDWDEDAEDEADFLAGVLLVSEKAAIQVVKRGLTLAAAAEQYGVSVPLMRWRINTTGARVRVARARRGWSRY